VTSGAHTGGAFERLYRRHVAEVYRFAWVMLWDRTEAEDVTRATFIDAYRALERGERPSDASTWLIAIARTRCRARASQPDDEPDDGLCTEAQRDVSRRLDGMLDRPERKALRAHLRVCPECTSLAQRMRAQRTLLQELGKRPLPASLGEGIPLTTVGPRDLTNGSYGS
jgi:DNA-directed RNA polymerase specialized sigma24 family protein